MKRLPSQAFTFIFGAIPCLAAKPQEDSREFTSRSMPLHKSHPKE